MARVSSFMIMMLLFGILIAGIFIPLLDYGDQQYGIDDYNSSTLNDYNKIEELQNQTQELKDKTLELQSRSGVLDVLGGFFEAGYDAIKIAFSSFGTFLGLSNSFFQDIPIYNSSLFYGGLITIALIIIVFIIIRIAVKDKI